nr:DUF6880 family protein [Caulobacter hibisci]
MGPEALSELLMEVAEGHPAIKRRLKLALLGEVGAADLAAEIDKRIDAIADSRARINWRKFKEFVRDLDAHRASAAGRLGELDPNLAVPVLVRLVRVSEDLEGRIKDPKGELLAVFDQAVADVARLSPKALTLDSRSLADALLAFVTDASTKLSVDLLRAAAPALAGDAVAVLRGQVRERLAVQRRPDPRLRAAAQVLADLEGDVEGFAALFTASQQVLPPIGAQIARRYLAVGRTAEALAALDQSTPGPADRADPGALAWDEARIAALEAAGEPLEAQAVRWASFKATLSVEMLRAFLKGLPDFEDVEAEDQALDYAQTYPDPHKALAFLTAWPSAAGAAKLVMERGPALRGDREVVLEPAARLLEHRYPLAATVLLRAMVDDVVRYGRADRYADAARWLLEAESLVPGLPDDAAIDDHVTWARRVAGYRRL